MNRAALLLVFFICAALAVVLEFGRHAGIAEPQRRDVLLGIEMLVWIVAGCALLRRQNLRV